MGRMSNRDRIFRAAEEARLAEEERLAKKAAKPAAGTARKRPSKTAGPDARMKLVWGIFNTSGRAVQTFAYGEKAQAEAEHRRITRSTEQPHELRAIKVPMDS